MKERLSQMLEKAIRYADEHYCGKPIWDGEYTSLMADHLLAEAVIVLPVKVGQDGYWLISNDIRLVTFDKIYTVGTDWCVRARYFLIETVRFSFDDFGKTVFLTREEAEKALAEREGEIR